MRVQFLGFRYSGWQKQPGQKTIEGMLSKTLSYILPTTTYKILGAGRTDAKVSALDGAFELFLEDHPIDNAEAFLAKFNKNLPPDIRITKIFQVDEKFNIIESGSEKEYIYLFSYGEKNHPFCAPFMANIMEDLDVERMRRASKLFIGEHNFRAYTARPRENAKFIRSIKHCEIIRNDILKANFFPKDSYIFRVIGKGFMRYQIRMFMGALFQIGKGELQMDDIKNSLKNPHSSPMTDIAPGSGLLLNRLDFN